MEGIINDELQIYRGKDIYVKKGIVIHQPNLDEICDYGERDYWSLVNTLTSVGADMKFQLYDMGIDYTQVNDFELFHSLLTQSLSQKKTSILFGDLNFTNFNLFKKTALRTL